MTLKHTPILCLATTALIALLIPLGGCADDGAEAPFVVAERDATAEECPHGGRVVEIGQDLNGDGSPSPEATADAIPICDGESGEAGAPGDLPSISVQPLAPDDECPLGGKEVVSGDQSHRFCHQSCTDEPPFEFILDTASMPQFVHDDYAYPLELTTDADHLSVTAVSSAALTDTSLDAYPSLDLDLQIADQRLDVTLQDGIAGVDFILFATDGCHTRVASLPIVDTGFDGVANIEFIHLSTALDIVEAALYLTNDVVRTLRPFSPYNSLSVPADTHIYDILQGDSFILTMPDIVAHPGTLHMAYLVDDADGEPSGRHAPVSPPAATNDQLDLQVIHAADGTDDIQWSFDGDDEGLQFQFTTASDQPPFTQVLEADPSALLTLHIDGDTFTYSSTEGHFDAGGHLSAIAFPMGSAVAIALIDHANFQVSHHLPDELQTLITETSSPSTPIPANDAILDTISIADCSTVADIDLDIDVDHDTPEHLVLTLRTPDNVFHHLWHRESPTGGQLVGNFPTTLISSSSQTQPIGVFVGRPGNGDWDLIIDDQVTGTDGTLNNWSLNLTCL